MSSLFGDISLGTTLLLNVDTACSFFVERDVSYFLIVIVPWWLMWLRLKEAITNGSWD